MDWAWFFDIDGTLVEIAQSPSRIVVHDELPDLIARLYELSGGAVSLITGRSIADVDSVLPLEGISIAGQHGLEVRSADGGMLSRVNGDASLAPLTQELAKSVASHSGLRMEFKGGTVALHYREAPSLASYAHRLIRRLRDTYVPAYVLQKGKRVVELRPPGSDKGQAVRMLMSTKPFSGRVPVFIGDDVTDEVGFGAVNAMSGHSIKVGAGRTVAQWRLRDVSAVRDWLRAGVDAADASSVSMTR
jgi:trehalose 6-phosphate phosphatase